MKKKILSLIIVLVMAIGLFPSLAFAQQNLFAGGSGTENDPYLISDAKQLRRVISYSDSHFRLTCNIDFSKESGFYSLGKFKGVFDGAGYSISNIKIMRSEDNKNIHVGLFEENEGIIKNLSVIGCHVTGKSLFSKQSSYSTLRVGAIVGTNSGTITDCASLGDVSAIHSVANTEVFTVAGGIAGWNIGTGIIERCYNVGKVVSVSHYSARVGGIVGYGGGVIKDCYNAGEISASLNEGEYTEVMAGGISGWFNGRIENCYNAGKIIVKENTKPDCKRVGGIVGFKDDNKAESENCYYVDNIAVGVTNSKDTFVKLSESRMCNKNSFYGFDFENTWKMLSDSCYKYPMLRGLPVNLFVDVAGTAWYKQYVDFAAGQGIFGGRGNNNFAPEANITRAEFVQVLANLSKADTTNKKVTTKFKDVKSGDWFAPAVKWASDNKIVSGKSATSFDPNAKITREEMCVMLVNYASFKRITLKAKESKQVFADDSKISPWAKERVYMCQAADIVNGKGANKFDPSGNALRAEAATIFTLFYKEYLG